MAKRSLDTHKNLLKNLGQNIFLRFEWEVPHVPGDENVFITASRMQHAPQANRLWILPQLFKVATFDELAEQLYDLLIKREKSKVPSEQWFRKLLLDKKYGLIALEDMPSFLRKLEGVTLERVEEVVKRNFTKKDLENRIKFYEVRHKIKDTVNNNNEILFKNAIAQFDKISKNVKINSNTAMRIVEITYTKPAKIRQGQRYINPSNARYILDRVFSSVGRSAGGRLAGVPLATLHKDRIGIEAKIVKNIDNEFRAKYVYGKFSGENTFSIKKRRVKIGQPYVDRLIQASKLVTQVIDLVGRHLDEYIKNNSSEEKNLFSVEKLSEFALKNLEIWFKDKDALTYNGRRSRTHQNMDFFFLPDKKIRKKIINDTKKNNGFISDQLKKLLQKETLKGTLQLAVVDISGGGGTTGLSQFVAKLLGYKESGSMHAYINSMVATYENKYGKKPSSIIICPRIDDLTLTSIEYIPIIEGMIRCGIKVNIVLAERLEESLQKWDGKSRFTTVTWDGRTIVPELVAKRFTFLGAGLNDTTDRGYVRAKLPPGVEILPSPASRIPASDKRINSKILELLKPKLEKLGVVVIPTKVITIVDRNKMETFDNQLKKADINNSVKLQKIKDNYVKQGVGMAIKDIITFAKNNQKEWPEIGFLGLILKLDDKRPGRAGKGGELVSAYPIPTGILKAVIDNRKISKEQEKYKFYFDEIITHRINNLVNKGVYDIIIQPNLLTAFSDGEDFMETKLFVYAKPVERRVDEKQTTDKKNSS